MYTIPTSPPTPGQIAPGQIALRAMLINLSCPLDPDLKIAALFFAFGPSQSQKARVPLLSWLRVSHLTALAAIWSSLACSSGSSILSRVFDRSFNLTGSPTGDFPNSSL